MGNFKLTPRCLAGRFLLTLSETRSIMRIKIIVEVQISKTNLF